MLVGGLLAAAFVVPEVWWQAQDPQVSKTTIRTRISDGPGEAGIRIFGTVGRAHPEPAETRQADRAHVRELIRSPNSEGDTLDPFAARQDKQYVFAPDRRAVLAYRSLFGVALASGDPVGASDQFLPCLREFVARSDKCGLRPVVMLVRHDRLDLYRHLGFKALYLGDEAVLDVATFSLAGRRMRNARHAVNRSANFGVTTEVLREADITRPLASCLRDVAVRARRGKREEGFSTALEEPFTVPQPSCVVAICRDRVGKPIGFQRYSPCCGETKLSVDAMRRLPEAPNGLNERMIVDVLRWARHNGILELSLNFIAFRRLIDDLGTRTAATTSARVIRRLNPAGAPSLFAFSQKFQPRWIPRYLAYRTFTDIPRLAIAALSAEGRTPPWMVRLGAHR